MDGIAKGTFDVTLAPVAMEGIDPATLLGARSINKRIHGDLEAVTSGQMLSAMTGTRGSAAYVAVEHVRGALAGRSGSFVFVHRGLMNRGAQSLQVEVVPDSGTDGFTGLEGTFAIDIRDGVHYYEFRWSLPDR